MATTGFWPVKSNLKYTLDYAENPDKTTAEKYLDNDLYATLRYVENDDKTDRKLFVTGINCVTERAYECMMSTKKRYGKPGGNLAYHGYQSFAEGEVTPEECHQIGIETAKRMWGDKYEVIVTTHLNTQNHLHNHFVVNSVSFRTGEKFKNKIGDHLELRKISDEICREHEKSVLENATFFGGEKGAYWVHKDGGITNHDQVKADTQRVIKLARNKNELIEYFKRLGYEVDETRLSVKAPDWERAVRLSSVGFTKEYINEQFERNRKSDEWYAYYRINYITKPKTTPLKKIMRDIERDVRYGSGIESLVAAAFLIMIMLIKAAKDNLKYTPLSPTMRMEMNNLKQYVESYHFLNDNNIQTTTQLYESITETEQQIKTFETERQNIRNRIRRASPEEKVLLKAEAKNVTAKITPLRDKHKKLKQTECEFDKIQQLFDTELKLEKQAERNKNYDKGR